MGDPVGLVLSVLDVLGRAREAAESAQNFPSTIKDRLADGESVLEQLQRDPRHVVRIVIERKLDQLNGLAGRIKNLVQNHTAAPGDSCRMRMFKTVVNTVGGLLASRRVFCWLPLLFFCSYWTNSD